MAGAAPITAGAGGGIGAFGALVEGQSQANALKNAAQIQTANAAEALEAGKFNATRQQIAAGKTEGQTEADLGAAGVSGASAFDLMAQSHMNSEMDRLNILHGADIRAINYQNQAAMDEIGAKSAMTGSYFNAVSKIFQAGSKISEYGSGTTAAYTPPGGGGGGGGNEYVGDE